MSIKVRLLLSYIAMIIIPVVLFALVAGTLISLLLNNVSGTGERKDAPAFWQTLNQRNELFAGVRFMAEADPDRFSDIHFLQMTDERLSRSAGGLVVVKNGRIRFVSRSLDNVDPTHLYDQLQTFDAERTDHGRGPKINDRYSAEKYDLTFADNSPGTLYLLSDMTPMIERMRQFFPMLVLSLLVIIVLTNGVLTFLVSRSIVKPLYALKHAAEQIKDGNLDHEVKWIRKDEIGQLGSAFEDMRRRLNESIRLQLQYEENRKELVSSISHDLKTPITAIKACVEGIQDGIADNAPKREKYMSMISKKTKEMDRLIDELFYFSKLDLKRVPYVMEPINLAAYLSECVEELRLDPRMEGITFTFSNEGKHDVHVMADIEKLHRMIMNMIENSLKYMNKDEKQIHVELTDGDEEATVKIEDNGSGIESDALPYVFDRFYRAEPSRNTATGGSGLGLAIVKQIVEGHGGSVKAESRLGEGTSISITLRKSNGGDRA